MKRLGYTRYVAQGGDWGAGVVQAMGRQAPAGLLGIHTNLPCGDHRRHRRGARRRPGAGWTGPSSERAAIDDAEGLRPSEAAGPT